MHVDVRVAWIGAFAIILAALITAGVVSCEPPSDSLTVLMKNDSLDRSQGLKPTLTINETPYSFDNFEPQEIPPPNHGSVYVRYGLFDNDGVHHFGNDKTLEFGGQSNLEIFCRHNDRTCEIRFFSRLQD